MSFETLAIIPLLPLIAAAITSGMECGRRAAALAIGAMGISCGVAMYAFVQTWPMATGELNTYSIPWITVGTTQIDWSFVLDPLTGVMLAMVTFVGLLIFIYSAGYMAKDRRMARFFCYLSLFATGMLGLVLSNSLLLLFMFWEIVGVASYLLISFWFHKPEAAAAGKKAFIVTRIGDLGFFIGLLLVFQSTGTLTLYGPEGIFGENSRDAATLVSNHAVLGAVAGAASLLLFIGAIGKSGQVPLHVWLPDAMEGPTPVSALIHAATMVAAGVFLVARTFPLFEAGGTLHIVALTGAVTALVAAVIALGQFDLKRILAYSTISQLGLMMVGLGVAGVAVGMFHLLTHAFFKALLFLAAGSVIHGCHEEQDIRRMGGLWHPMRLTAICYLCGVMALVAFPFTSGFFSKEAILNAAWQPDNSMTMGVFWMTALASLFTAIYMTRQWLYVFAGSYRGEGKPHESGRLMVVPLVILAVFALLGGLAVYVLPAFLGASEMPHHTMVMVIGVGVSLGGILIGWLVYRGRDLGADNDPLAVEALRNQMYFDETYEATVGGAWTVVSIVWEQLQELLKFLQSVTVRLARGLSRFFTVGIDRQLIDGFGFDGLCEALRGGGRAVVKTQSGLLPAYLRYIALGAVALGLLVFWMK